MFGRFKEVQPSLLMSEGKHQILGAHIGRNGKSACLIEYNVHVLGGLLLPGTETETSWLRTRLNRVACTKSRLTGSQNG